MLDLDNVKKIHMVGIGGAGMCALAEIMIKLGYIIEGSDQLESDNTYRLKSNGVKVTIGHDIKNIVSPDAVVYSAAIPNDNCEIVYSLQNKIPVYTRAELFGAVSKKFDKVIAVSGTHGKTTVTSMLFHIFRFAGKNPSALIGGCLNEINGNAALGGKDLLICEACEFSKTFLNLKRNNTVILNIDNDHLEQYHSIDNLCKAFDEFSSKSEKCFSFADDPLALKCSQSAENQVLFGIKKGKYRAENLSEKSGKYSFDLLVNDKKVFNINLKIPGYHNVINALAAASVAFEEGLDSETIRNGIESFNGASRRFEIISDVNGITVVDDYAHHPAEIEAVLRTAKKMNYNRIIAVFQPFTYSRTKLLLNDFIKALSAADINVICPIMGGREVNTFGISSSDLASGIKNAVCCGDFIEASEKVCELANPNDLVITMGCGNIYKCARMIVGKLK